MQTETWNLNAIISWGSRLGVGWEGKIQITHPEQQMRLHKWTPHDGNLRQMKTWKSVKNDIGDRASRRRTSWKCKQEERPPPPPPHTHLVEGEVAASRLLALKVPPARDGGLVALADLRADLPGVPQEVKVLWEHLLAFLKGGKKRKG